MSTDEPTPGSGEPPDDDPFRKRPSTPPGGGGPPQGDASSPPPPPPPPPGGTPYGPGPWEGAGAEGVPPGGGGEPFGAGGPYGGGPYGEQYATDPLAGMPPLANRGRRLLARIIDGLLIGVPVGALMTLAVGGYDFTNAEDTGKTSAVQIVVLLVYFVYEALMLTNSGQTVGKKVMKIRVAMLDNGAIPAGQAGWYRAGVYSLPQIIPCCGFLFWLVNVLFCTWDKPYQQCVHDKAAKTVVVEAR